MLDNKTLKERIIDKIISIDMLQTQMDAESRENFDQSYTDVSYFIVDYLTFIAREAEALAKYGDLKIDLHKFESFKETHVIEQALFNRTLKEKSDLIKAYIGDPSKIVIVNHKNKDYLDYCAFPIFTVCKKENMPDHNFVDYTYTEFIAKINKEDI